MANVRALFLDWLIHMLWGQYSTLTFARRRSRAGYNQGVRLTSTLLLLFCLAACQRGGTNNTDAIRQGVIDYLAKSNFNVAAMDVKVTSVETKGDQADMAVAVTLKGQSSGPAMPFAYHLEHQNSKWVVTGHANSAGHGGEANPAANPAANPHGGAMPGAAPGGDNPHGGAGKMPSPNDLPPAKK